MQTKRKENSRYLTTIRAWIKYKSDNIFVAGPILIIPLLALISICLILIFSSLYLWSGEAETYSQSLWETFMRTLGFFLFSCDETHTKFVFRSGFCCRR